MSLFVPEIDEPRDEGMPRGESQTAAIPLLLSPEELANTLMSDTSLGEAPYGIDAATPREDLELGKLLGQGGVGQVWRAHQRSLDRDVAVKQPHRGGGAAAARAVVREARITGALQHPSVVPIHGLVIDDGVPTVVMKRVSGAKPRGAVACAEAPYMDRHWLR